MGFTTGFIGGLTATYTLLYLSLHLHRANRQHQSLLLAQQKGLLNSIHDPQPLFADSPAYEVRKAGIAEELKDRWNREIETAVRGLQETDWQEVRVRWEQRAANAWSRVKSSDVAQEVEQRIKDNVATATETVKGGAKEAVSEKRLLEIK